MEDSEHGDKNVSPTEAEAQRIEHIAALVHEMRTTGCQVIDILGQAEADPSSTVTDPEREARRLIGQLGVVLNNLVETQKATEATTSTSTDTADEAETNSGGLGELFGEVDGSSEEAELRGFE